MYVFLYMYWTDELAFGTCQRDAMQHDEGVPFKQVLLDKPLTREATLENSPTRLDALRPLHSQPLLEYNTSYSLVHCSIV